MTQDQIEEALRRSLRNFTSPTIGRAGSIHDGQQGYILYDDHVAYIVRDLLAALTAPPVAHGAISDAMVEALRQFIYETTHLSREEDDGSHRCIISKQTLEKGRAALAPAPAQQGEHLLPARLVDSAHGKAVRKAEETILALTEAHQMEVNVLHEALYRALSHFEVMAGEQSARAASEITDIFWGGAAPEQDWRPIETQAARDVLAERRRQVEAEGWTPEHDDDHDRGELAHAAACYALRSWALHTDMTKEGVTMFAYLWPFTREWWKPKDRRRNLIIAGALILAEIERLDRLPSPPLAETKGE